MSNYEIIVEQFFNATHALRMPDGSTEPVHGHDWLVTMCLRSRSLDQNGWVADFHDLQKQLRTVLEDVNHRNLNDHPWFHAQNPTAEVVARVLFEQLAKSPDWGDRLQSVTVTEAPGCAARFTRA